MDVGKIRRKQDLSTLGPNDTVRNSEESMHILIAARARSEDVIGVLDDERIMLTGNELQKDPIALECVTVSRVQHLCTRSLAARDGGKNSPHEPCLAGSRRTLEDEDGLRRGEIPLDEPGNGLAQRRICLIQQCRVRKLFERSSRRITQSSSRKPPVHRERLFSHAPLADDPQQELFELTGALRSVGPECEGA